MSFDGKISGCSWVYSMHAHIHAICDDVKIHAWVSASLFDDTVSYDLNSGFTNRSPRFFIVFFYGVQVSDAHQSDNIIFYPRADSGKQNFISMRKTKFLAVMCCTAMLFAACEKNEPKEANNHDTKNDTKEAVDLGVSVKWATCNLGATKPEEYGNYYAWGETTTKSDYSWSTYKYGSDYNALTKYCTNSDYGTVDNMTILEAADDAATQNWGSNWRMPTIDEWEELLEKCTWTWTTLNGVDGYEVKATNGNSIFLPATGCRNDDGLHGAGSDGYYWSSSLNTDYPGTAQFVNFYSNRHYTSSSARRYGRPVRPVVAE